MGVKKVKNNIGIIIPTVILTLFGLLMVYSSSSIWSEYKYNDSLYYLRHQSIFVVVGFILMYIISKINY